MTHKVFMVKRFYPGYYRDILHFLKKKEQNSYLVDLFLTIPKANENSVFQASAADQIGTF